MFMLKIQKLMFIAMISAFALGACMTEGQGSGDDNESTPIIQSAEQLDSYLQSTSNSPLHLLSADARQRFIASLVFSDRGLGSFRYTELEKLSATEIAQILGLFGVERTTSLITKARVSTEADKALMRFVPLKDHEGYDCTGRATCRKSIDAICTSNC
jgi:hypothetical protein